MLADDELDAIFEYPATTLGHILGYTRLEKLHDKWICDCWLRDNDYTLQAHRNSYKTTSIIVVGTIWWLLFHPDHRVLILRKTYEDAASIVDEIRRQYESEAYRAVFGNMRTRNWGKSSLTIATKKSVTKEGSIEPLGIGGSVTGRHYDKIAVDDIVTIRDRVSKAERETTKTFVKELKNIPTHEGNIFFTGTPWHRDDAFAILPPAVTYPYQVTGIIPPEKISELRLMGASLFAANYELKHIADENRFFGEPNFAPWPDDFETIAYLDPAFQGSDNVALSIGARYKRSAEEDEFVRVRGFVWPGDIADIMDEIVERLKESNVGTVTVEKNADKGYVARDLKKLWPSVATHHEAENKHLRITHYVKKEWKKILFDSDVDPAYLNQILDYQEGQKPADAPDSLAGLMRKLGFGKGTFSFKGLGPNGAIP